MLNVSKELPEIVGNASENHNRLWLPPFLSHNQGEEPEATTTIVNTAYSTAKGEKHSK
jgi:hypothetical protein